MEGKQSLLGFVLFCFVFLTDNGNTNHCNLYIVRLAHVQNMLSELGPVAQRLCILQ